MTQNSPLESLFPRARWVAASPKNAPVNSPTPAGGIVGASVPLGGGAYSRSHGEHFIIVRDPEHHLLGCLVAHASLAFSFWRRVRRDQSANRRCQSGATFCHRSILVHALYARIGRAMNARFVDFIGLFRGSLQMTESPDGSFILALSLAGESVCKAPESLGTARTRWTTKKLFHNIILSRLVDSLSLRLRPFIPHGLVHDTSSRRGWWPRTRCALVRACRTAAATSHRDVRERPLAALLQRGGIP